MTEQRRRGLCEECGDEDVKMATTHACYKCYVRARREREAPDLHNPSLRKEHLKLVKLYGKLMEVLAGVKVNDETKDAVVVVLRPYFRLVEHLVNLNAEMPTKADADERRLCSETAVERRTTQLGRERRTVDRSDSDVRNNVAPELAHELRALVELWKEPRIEIDGELNPAYFEWMNKRDGLGREVLLLAASHGNIRAQKSLEWVAKQQKKRSARARANVNVNCG